MSNEQSMFEMCPIHHLKEKYQNLDKSKLNKEFICQLCKQKYFESFDEKQNKIVQLFSTHFSSNFIILNNLKDLLGTLHYDFFNQLCKQIEQMRFKIREFTMLTITQKSELITNLEQKADISQQYIKYLEEYRKFKNYFLNFLEYFKNDYYLKRLVEYFDILDFNIILAQDQQENIQINNFEETQTQIEQLDNNIKYDYQLLHQSSIYQIETCYDIAFNKDASILVAGCFNDIRVFEFKGKKLDQLQLLKGHTDYIDCLQFMKRSNQFISAGTDKKILIWSQNDKKEWLNFQILKGHKNRINFLIINQNEDLIISGGDDDLIIFWSLNNNNQWSLNQELKFEGLGHHASLNDSGTQLIFFQDNFIRVLENKGNIWIITQSIKDQHRYEFVVQPFVCKQLKFYRQINNLFQFVYQVKIYQSDYLEINGFPINFSQTKQFLISKNGNHLNFLRRRGNGKFLLENSFEFCNGNFSGRVSDDGQFLITWVKESKQFQIRMLNKIK